MNKRAYIPISALMGALLLAVIAAMTPFVAGPDLAYAQAQSADADLQSLAAVGSPSGGVHTGGDFAPTFAAATTEYTVRTIFNDTGVTVTAEANHAEATVKINGQTPNASNQVGVPVVAGMTTTIPIVVTAEAGNTKRYTLKVYRNRSSLSNNANLSSLSIMPSGGLKESDTSTSTAPVYEARVQSDKVTVDYTLSDTAGGASAAVAAGSGTTIADAAKPKEITLGTEGATGTFTVTVTAENASTKTYTINVYRIRDNPSPDATLSALTLNDQGGNDAIPSGAFAATTMMYDLTVADTVEYVTVAPTAADAGAQFVISPSNDARPGDIGHQVNLRAGVDTTITVTVTAEDPSSMETYTIQIYKRRPDTATNPSPSDNTLSALSISPAGTLMPAFRSSTITYNAQVASGVEKVTVSYTPTNNLGGVTVAVANTTTAANVDGNEVTLEAAGATTVITLTVNPEDGTSTAGTYTINVYRLRALPSADATLATLAVTGASPLTPSPEFVANTLSTETHRIRAPFTDTRVTVAATATGAANGATVDISPASPVNLTAGMENEITITVTAEDRMTTAEYKIIVYRLNNSANISDDATLSALSLSDGMLMPAFMSDRMEYDARVGNDVGKVTAMYTPTDNAGGVVVRVTEGGTNASTAGEACNTTGVGDEVTLGAGGTETLIHVCVTPENGAAADTKVYAISVFRENANLNTDADLSAFAITDVNVASGVTASAGEACGTDTTRVACNLLTDSMPVVEYRVRTVSIDTTASDPIGAVVEIVSPADKNPSTARHDIDLPAGQVTEIVVMVTAEDPSVTKTYMASVYRRTLSPSDDATLSSLMVSGATLMPEFASDEMEYTAEAANSTEQVTVSAMATDDAGGARVAYGTHTGAGTTGDPIVFTPGTDTNRDMDGHQVNLGAAGTDTGITVQVTAEDGTMDYYIITVTRADMVSDNAKLKSLKLMHGGEEISLLTAKYWWNTLDCPQMRAVVGDGEMEGDMATYCVMYDDLSAAGKMKVDEVFAMSVEDAWNMIGCTLMKQAVGMDNQAFCAMYADLGDSEMMTVYEVYRPTMFSVMVGSDVDMTNVMAEAAHVGATVSGDTGMQDLMVGENTIEVMVTAEDGETMMTYTVMVTREAPEPTDPSDVLLERYDADDSGDIDLDEVSAAIDDYFAGNLTLEEVSAVIDLYFSS